MKFLGISADVCVSTDYEVLVLHRRYVEEEIARVKALYESRENALATQRDELMEQLKLLCKVVQGSYTSGLCNLGLQCASL